MNPGILSKSKRSPKQLMLLVAMICCIAFTSKAATISGTVSYVAGYGPAISKKVYLLDTSFSGTAVIDSTTTSGTGSYTFTLTMATGHAYYTQSNACGYPSYCPGGITSSTSSANISLVCVPTVTDTVRTIGTGALVSWQKVYIRNATSTFLDSSLTNGGGIASFIIPASIASGTLTVFTYACGLQSQTVSYCGASAVAPTLQICGPYFVSGTLTNVSTSSAIPWYKVYLVDSSATSVLYRDSMYTNSSGAYTFMLPVGTPAGNIVIYTQACGMRSSNSAAFTGGSNLAINLSVCATSAATISGTLIAGGTSSPVAGQKVYLTDSASPTLVLRDSVTTTTAGVYSFTISPLTPTGNITLSTMSCGAMQSQYTYYFGSSKVMPNWSVYTSSASRTISGTVYYKSGAVAPGFTVSLTYSGVSTSPHLYLVTNAAGAYSFTIPCDWNAGTLKIYTYYPFPNCSPLRNYIWSGSSASGLVDTACYHSVSGTVRKQGGGVAANARVYAILSSLDTSVTPHVTRLTAVDSTVTNSTGQYTFVMNVHPYSLTVLPQAVFIKAALQPSDPSYWSYLPTYHDSSLIWSAADTVDAMAWGNHTGGFDISLRSGVNPGGPGFIGGDVLLGANKSTGVGDPLPGRIFLLTTTSGMPVAYTYSDGAGKFSFSNLALGSYLLHGDAWGKSNPPLAVTLTTGNTSVSNIIFEENSVHFEGHYNTLSVPHSGLEGIVSLFPNPAKDQLYIAGLSSIQGEKRVIVRDITGAVVLHTALIEERLNVSRLPAGVYMLQVITGTAAGNFRFVKE